MEQPGGGFVDGVFKVLPTVKKVCELVDGCMETIYKPLLGRHIEPTSNVDVERAGLEVPFAMLQNDADQLQSIEPEMIDGFRFTHNTNVAERIGRTSTWKFGNGNPMFGIPGTAFETSLTWMGNKMCMPAKGPPSPNLQLQVGPFSYTDLINGSIGQTQLVHNTLKSQTFLVNDCDLNSWRVFMLGNRYAHKIGKIDFKTNCMVQAPGGVGAIFKGQSMIQAEVAAYLGRWKNHDVSFGIQGGSPIPAAVTWKDVGLSPLTVLMNSFLTANPYLIIHRHNTLFEADKSLNSENLIKVSYDRKEKSISCSVSSTPSTSDSNMIHQSTKSPAFLKDVSRNVREEYFTNWAYTERNGYKVTSTLNLESQKFNYGLHMHTKWFNKKTSSKMSITSKPGDILPSVFQASISENMMINAENNPQAVSPMTTELSFVYDADAGKPPKLGLGITFEL